MKSMIHLCLLVVFATVFPAVVHAAELAATPSLRGTCGTYDAAPRQADGHVDISRLVDQLVDIQANTYNWLIAHRKTDWDDLHQFLPKARRAGIRVWVSLVPPSESPPHTSHYSEPYKLDYKRWASEIAKLSLKEPNLVAWSIDDFTHNLSFYTPKYVREMQQAARRVNPKLAFVPCTYSPRITPDFARRYHGLIDGLLFPYRAELTGANLKDATKVEQEVKTIRGIVGPDLPIIVDVYATRHSHLGASTPEYVREVMRRAHGCADGVLVYCHQSPERNPAKYVIIKRLFHRWRSSKKNGQHALPSTSGVHKAQDSQKQEETTSAFDAWWVDSLEKVLATAKPTTTGKRGEILAARGEVEAIQIAVRSGKASRVAIKVAPFNGQLPVRVRRVGRVPIRRGTRRTPPRELVASPPVDLPDPLFPEQAMTVRANHTECFWLDVAVPDTVPPGKYETKAVVTVGDQKAILPLILQVFPATVPFQGKLLVTNWFSVRPKELGFGDAPVGSKAWFASANLLFDCMWAHRLNMFWTPLRPPWITPVATADGKLGFDFSLFDRWVEAFSHARGGTRKTYIEGQPIASRSGYNGHVKARVWRLIDGKPHEELVEADDPIARAGYRVFLTALRDHLKEKGWLDRFRIHITDEPHGHQLKPYAVLAGYVHEFAPEFPIMEALDVHDDFAFFEKNCDVWVPQLGRFDKSLDRMLERLKHGKEVWIYTCLFPTGAYPNRFVDYPLIKTRILHWINFRWGFTGYLHWGFNQWRGGDPYKQLEPAHGGSSYLPPGDAWIVYPGKKQVVESIRLEAMRDGIEDFELLTLLAKKNPGKAREIAQKAVRTFTDYVRDIKQFRMLRRSLLEALQ